MFENNIKMILKGMIKKDSLTVTPKDEISKIGL
jgi:hypothetical protein